MSAAAAARRSAKGGRALRVVETADPGGGAACEATARMISRRTAVCGGGGATCSPTDAAIPNASDDASLRRGAARTADFTCPTSLSASQANRRGNGTRAILGSTSGRGGGLGSGLRFVTCNNVDFGRNNANSRFTPAG